MQLPEPASRRPLVYAGAAAVLLTLGLGALVSFRSHEPNLIDLDWMREMLEHRGPGGEAIARVFDVAGGGWVAILVVPIGVAIAFLFARRPWSALAFVLASALGSALCQLLKAAFGRHRPEEILLPLDNGSFPSGHVTNAAVIAVVLGLLLRRVWIWVLGAVYVVAMAVSRTYLGAHWLTDTLGGALLGGGVAVLVWCALLPLLRREPLGSESRLSS